MAPNQGVALGPGEGCFRLSEMVCPETGKLYIFGYGSLIWKPNITYTRSWSGYIKGYKRRFYQGTTTHRGTPQRPGRVLTLIPTDNKEARVWGKTYEVDGPDQINAAIENLGEREMNLGGYIIKEVSFFPWRLVHRSVEAHLEEDQLPKVLRALVYIAEPMNEHYFGKAPLKVQARQIATAVGRSGSNVEYLRKLVDFITSEVPEHDVVNDQYVLDLWDLVEEYLHNAELSADVSASSDSIDTNSANSPPPF